jgi:hypothetical protein
MALYYVKIGFRILTTIFTKTAFYYPENHLNPAQRLAPRVACLAAVPNSSRRFGPANEVKERLHWSAL